ncbi:MAG: polysaccharide biosynthesis/export family protein [Flavobacteriales bacterium]|nr:polysaccharide biosynthesis/export family protein [Flavobacteriales bacterium]
MRLRPFALLTSLMLSVVLFSPSCITRKDISYFQDISDTLTVGKISQSYEAFIQPGDIISVHVSSLSQESNTFFNSIDEESGRLMANTYLVDASGAIDMPLIGSVKVSESTTQVAKFLIRNKLDKYLVEPTVRVRIKNFKVTVLGEVTTPGVYNIPDEKITLVEALGLAGDLTIFAQRNNVLLIREKDGNRQFVKVDLRSKEFFESEYYYLHSNDILYVEPGKGKIASADAWYRILPIVFSGITAVALFLTRIPFN